MPSVLVVDDDKSYRQYLVEICEGIDFDVFYSSDATQCMQMMESLQPDLLIIDLIMPNIDGAQLIKEIRKSNTKTPILVVTGSDDQELIQKSRDNGANEVLTKPFKQADIFKQLKGLLASSFNE